MPVSLVKSSMTLCGMYSDQQNRLIDSAARAGRCAATAAASATAASVRRMVGRMGPPAGSLAAAAHRLGGDDGQHGRRDEDGGNGVEGGIESLLHASEDLERQRSGRGARGEVRDDQLV